MDIRNHIFKFNVADGVACYQVNKIKGKVVYLSKIKNHPENPDNYGEPARLMFLDQALMLMNIDAILNKNSSSSRA